MSAATGTTAIYKYLLRRAQAQAGWKARTEPPFQFFWANRLLPPPAHWGWGGLQAERGSQAASENGTPLGLSGICISLLVNYLFTLFLNGNTSLLGISSFP